jgi:signal transduction histidine kinase
MPLAEADGIQLNTNLTKTDPIIADAARLHQVLANLIANGLRYAPQGAENPPTVNVTVKNQSDSVRITIQDNGPGLTADQQQHIFDRFWRSDSARNRDEGGSGLGLAISQGIIDAHGGSISVASQLGSGTEMIVRLPKA